MSLVRTSPNPEAAVSSESPNNVDPGLPEDAAAGTPEPEQDKAASADNNDGKDDPDDDDDGDDGDDKPAADSEEVHHSAIDPETGPSPSPNPEEVKEERPEAEVSGDTEAAVTSDPAQRGPGSAEAAGEGGAEAEGDGEPPQHAVRFGEQQQPENLHVSPPGHVTQPLNLAHSPAHSATPPHPPYPPHRPAFPPHPEHYSYGPPPPGYPGHYFNNASSSYPGPGQPPPYSGPGPGFPGPGAEAGHDMYRQHLDPHHSSHLAHLPPHLGHFPRPDPYSFPTSDEELVSPPGRGPNPLSMGFSGMPMPLIAPKAQKPRKPRKPRSPKQPQDGTILSMQIKEDSRRLYRDS